MAARALRIMGLSLLGLLLAAGLALLLVALNPAWVSRPAENWVRRYLENNPLADSARLEFAALEWKPLRGIILHGVHLHRGEEGVFLGSVDVDGLGWRNGRVVVQNVTLDSLVVTGVPGAHWADWFRPWSDPADTSSSTLAFEVDELELDFWARGLEGDTLVAPSSLRMQRVVWESNALEALAQLELEVPAAGSVRADLRLARDSSSLGLQWQALTAQLGYFGEHIQFSLKDTLSNHLEIRVIKDKNKWLLPRQYLAWDHFALHAEGYWSDAGGNVTLDGSGLRAAIRSQGDAVRLRLAADSSQLPDRETWLAHGVVNGRYREGSWSLRGVDLVAGFGAQRQHFTELNLEGSTSHWTARIVEAEYGKLTADGDYSLESVQAQWLPRAPLRAGFGLPAIHGFDADWSIASPFDVQVVAFDSVAEVGAFSAKVQGEAWTMAAHWGAYQLQARWKRLPNTWNLPDLAVARVAEQVVAGRLEVLDSLGFASLDLRGPELDLHLAHEPSGTVGTGWWTADGQRASWMYRSTRNAVRHDLSWDGSEHAQLSLQARPGDSLNLSIRAHANHPRGGEVQLEAQIWPHGSVWDGGILNGYAEAWDRPESGDSVRLHGTFRGARHLSYDFDKQRFALSDPLYWSSPQGQLAVGGALSPNEGEVLRVQARNVDIPFWSRVAGLADLELGGSVALDAIVVGQLSGWAVSGGLRTDSLSLKKQSLGELNLDLDYVPERDAADLALNWDLRDTAIVHLKGSLSSAGFSAKTQQLNIPLRWARPFIEGSIDDLNGRLQGRVQLASKADFTDLSWSGSGFWSSAHLRIPTVGLGLTGTAPWTLTEKSLKLGPARFADHRGVGSAEITASIAFTGSELVDLRFKTERMVVLDLPPSRKADFYGYMVASGSGRLHGSSRGLRLDVRAKSADSSVFALPLDAPVSLDEVEFLNFRKRNEAPVQRKRTNDEFKFDVHLDLDVTEDVLARLILDETLGDVIEARGSGPIQLDVPWVGDMALRGSLTLDRGTYLFTLGNLINKPFSLVPGGSIRWTGDPYGAQMNLTARYRTRADVKDYLGLPEAGRQNIDVGLKATGPLFQPQLAFDVSMPNAGELAKAALASRMSYADERTTQVLSLLTISSFWLGSSPLAAQGMQAVESNTTQVLASQFTNFVTQGLGADWDVNLAYSANSAAAQREMEASIGRSFLDDRLSIQTEWGIPIGQSQPSIGLGDVEVRYQLSEDGRWSAKAYQRRNDRMVQTGVVGSQRQGVGVRFEQSGASWSQLLGGGKR